MDILKKIIIALIVVIAVPMSAIANDDPGKRAKWMKEMKQYKRDYIARELDLSREQQARFFPIYESMGDETRSLFDQTRDLERSVREKGDKATDLELEKAADALHEMKFKEGAIEKKYYVKFKTILTKQQLFKLKSVERKFMRKMVKEHHKKKEGKKH